MLSLLQSYTWRLYDDERGTACNMINRELLHDLSHNLCDRGEGNSVHRQREQPQHPFRDGSSVLVFVVPGGLNCFEGFVTDSIGVISERRKLGDHLLQLRQLHA